MTKQKFPKDIMKLILNYYLEDYSWISFGLGKHVANEGFICCENCQNINKCKESLYHKKQSAMKNMLALSTLKYVCKFWNYYITEWFNNNWGVPTWKKLHHIDKIIKYTDKATPYKIVHSFFDQLFGIIGSQKSFVISFSGRQSHKSQLIYLTKISLQKNNFLKLHCKEISKHDNKHITDLYMNQDDKEDFGWSLGILRKGYYGYEYDLNICDIMSLLNLPNIKNMIDPEKMKHNKIRYTSKSFYNFDDY